MIYWPSHSETTRKSCYFDSVGQSAVHLSSVKLTSRIYQIQFELSCVLSSDELCYQLNPIIEHVYNPIDYAKDSYMNFLKTYIHSCKKLMFLGMNPGPWGMMQTGVSIICKLLVLTKFVIKLASIQLLSRRPAVAG